MATVNRFSWTFGMAFAIVLPLTAAASASPTGVFKKIGTFEAAGAITGRVEGPSPSGNGHALYVTQTYGGKALSVSAVDPETGETKPLSNPIKTEVGAYGLTLGPDGNMYMGTVPNAHLYRLNTGAQTLQDLGTPIPGEQVLWDLTAAGDGIVYGVTYPHCGLFSYNPKTGALKNLGRVSATNEYGRYIVAGNDGYVYIGTGTTNAGIVAYDIETGEFKEIVPPNARGIGFYHVAKNKNDVVYASGPGHTYLMQKGTAREISKQTFTKVMEAYTPSVAPKLMGAKRRMHIFRLTASANGTIYGSTILPMYIFSLDPMSGKFNNLGQWGSGEAYSLLWRKDNLLIGAYGAKAPLLDFDSTRPVSLAVDSGGNPAYVSYGNGDEGWRPMAMLSGEGDDIYVGAVAGYGTLSGQFVTWGLESGQIHSIPNVIPDQGIVSLAAGKDHIVYGGTSVNGGGGTTPSEKSAVLFGFDIHSRKVLWKTVPVQGAQGITDLILTSSGNVLGFAGNTLFEYVTSSGKIVHLADVDYGGLIYNSVMQGRDGRIYGLASKGVFEIDPNSGTTRLIGRSPEPITAGGAVEGGRFYFASGADVYEYELPN